MVRPNYMICVVENTIAKINSVERYCIKEFFI